MKFLIDMPLSPELAAWLREQGHDAVQAGELGLNRASDVDILVHAKQELRTVVGQSLLPISIIHACWRWRGRSVQA